MKYLKYILILVFLVLLDQLTKYFINFNLGSGIIKISLVKNTGIAFGLLQGFNWLFVIISFIILALIACYFRYVDYKFVFVLLGAGIIGNLIDRIFLGYVRDFISIWVWPVFNLADVYNTIAIALLIYYLVLKDYQIKR